MRLGVRRGYLSSLGCVRTNEAETGSKFRSEKASDMSLFGDYRVRIDPWEVDFGDQTPLTPLEGQLNELVDHEIELIESAWGPVIPNETPPHNRVVFVDGVRRLEARIQVRQGQQLIYGAFGSYAAGAVLLENSEASFVEVRVSRSVVLGSGERLPRPVSVRPDLVYEQYSTPVTEVDGPLRHIQSLMRQAEAVLARDLCREDTLTIIDGPLSFEAKPRGVALGYIKRVHQLYLPDKFIPLLATLPAGSRTPVFTIKTAKSGFDRYSWFQRLSEPGRGATELHGIVRLEVAADVGIEAARKLADSTTAWLPRTAPKRGYDPRSPQNLIPIGALEQRLRVCLGDAVLFRRWIEALVAKEALND